MLLEMALAPAQAAAVIDCSILLEYSGVASVVI